MKTIALFLLLVLRLSAADEPKPAPVMPSEVTLTTGRVLRNVQVIRWEKERVVLKYQGGVDPIAFSLIKSIPAEELKALQKAGLEDAKKTSEAKRQVVAAEGKLAELKQQSAELDKKLEEARDSASRNGSLMEGQTFEQVRLALGSYPTRKNDYASGREVQAIYELQNETYYVYFTAGRMTSWQKSERRR